MNLRLSGGGRRVSQLVDNELITSQKKTLEPKLKGYLPYLGLFGSVTRAFEITLSNFGTDNLCPVHSPFATIGVLESDNIRAIGVNLSGVKLTLQSIL